MCTNVNKIKNVYRKKKGPVATAIDTQSTIK